MNYILLGDVIAAAKVKRCGENDLPVLSITKSDGIVLQSEKFKKRIASKETADYKVVHRGQLVQGIHIDEANFGIQEVVDAGIVSPAYKIWNITSNIIVPKYLEIVLRSPRSIAYYASKFNGSIKRRERLSDKDFLEMRITCPPVEVQIHSIETLDKVSSLICHRKQQLTELDNLIKARFVEMFGDPVAASATKKKLSDIGHVFTGNTPSMKVPEYYDGNDIPFVKPGDIAEDGVTQIRKVDSFVSENARNVARIIPPYSVLVTCIGTIGKVGIAMMECCCNQQINFIVPNKGYHPIYLAYCLCFYKGILEEMANAPVVPIINKTQFSALGIPIAPIEKQETFAAFVEQTDKSKLVVQQSLEKLETLKKSLMQQYFG